MDQPNEKALTPLIANLNVAACAAVIRKREADALSDAMASEEAVQVAAGVLRLLPAALVKTGVDPLLTLRFESDASSALPFSRVALLLSATTGTTWRSFAEGLSVDRAALEAALLDRAAREEAPPKPSCEECGDSHRMELRGDLVPCTRCPVPCKLCRAGGGPYCGKSPYACLCHDKGRSLS